MRSQSRFPATIADVVRAGLLAGAILAATGSLAAARDDSFLNRVDFSPKHAKAWELPRRLTEISGLAVAPDGRVFTHDDESGIVYEIDPTGGRIVKAFALGDTTAKGDFEGIAVANGKIYLTTSDGVIYEAPEGDNGARVLYNTYETGIGRHCEVEGLAYDAAAGDLLIPCKTIRDYAFEDDFVLYRWSLASREAPKTPALVVPLDTLFADKGGSKSFRPSGIEIVPDTGNYLIVASLNHLIVEMTPAGTLISEVELDHGDHPQAEGITILPGPVLLISDEGRKKHDGRLALYRLKGAQVSRTEPGNR